MNKDKAPVFLLIFFTFCASQAISSLVSDFESKRPAFMRFTDIEVPWLAIPGFSIAYLFVMGSTLTLYFMNHRYTKVMMYLTVFLILIVTALGLLMGTHYYLAGTQKGGDKHIVLNFLVIGYKILATYILYAICTIVSFILVNRNGGYIRK